MNALKHDNCNELYAISFLQIKETDNDPKKRYIYSATRKYFHSCRCCLSNEIIEHVKELKINLKKSEVENYEDLDNLYKLLKNQIKVSDLRKSHLLSLYNYILINSNKLSFLSIINDKFLEICSEIKDNIDLSKIDPTIYPYNNVNTEGYFSYLLKLFDSGSKKLETVTPESLKGFEDYCASTLYSGSVSQKKYMLSSLLKKFGYGISLFNIDKDLKDEDKEVLNAEYKPIIENEIDKVQSIIENKEEFKEKYHHNFDAIDMYLCSLLSVEDIINYNSARTLKLNFFLRDESKKAYVIQKSNFSLKYISQRLAYSAVNEFYGKLDHKNTTSSKYKDYTSEQFRQVQEYLLRLNKRYGLPINKLTIVNMIDAVKNGYYTEYFNVAEDYKDEINKYTELNGYTNPFIRGRKLKK